MDKKGVLISYWFFMDTKKLDIIVWEKKEFFLK